MKTDWVAVMQPIVSTGSWYWKDGRVKPKFIADSTEAPWMHGPTPVPGMEEAGLDCGFLHIYHNNVFRGRAVHSFCLDCYKVVVCPENREQVEKISEWQQVNGYPGKVGAETRRYTKRLWGAYFYCRGLEDGMDRYRVVRKWVDENLGTHIKVFLKRGCTEFEQNLGDSDKWEMFEGQEEMEREGSQVIEYTPVRPEQHEVIKIHVRNFWDEWERLNRAPITYHDRPMEDTSEE